HSSSCFSPAAVNELAIELERLLDRTLDPEVVRDPRTRGHPELSAQLRILVQPRDRTRERRGVANGHDDAAPAIDDDLPAAAAVRHDRRDAVGHRLDQRTREPLAFD